MLDRCENDGLPRKLFEAMRGIAVCNCILFVRSILQCVLNGYCNVVNVVTYVVNVVRVCSLKVRTPERQNIVSPDAN